MKKLFENWRKSLNEAEYNPGRAVADIDTGEDYVEPEMAEKEAMEDLADKFNVQVMFAKTTDGKHIAVVTLQNGETMGYMDEEEMYQDLARRQEMSEGMDDFEQPHDDELSFEDTNRFVKAYNIISDAVENEQLPETVQDAVYEMLRKLGINL